MLVETASLNFSVDAQESADALHPAGATVDLSVVLACYNSAACLSPLYQRLSAVLQSLGCSYEIVFVEDGGTDNSWEQLLQLAKQDSRVRAYKQSRNFGQHATSTAGLSLSKGKWVVVMDCDLQDPPEYIPLLIEKALEGDYDVVLAERIGRQQNILRKAMADSYAWMLRVFSQPNFTGKYATFSLISRKVVDAFLQFSDQNRHYLLILLWLGFRQGSISYQHAERAGGKSSYSLIALIRHALQGIFFQTTVLLKSIVALGFATSVSGLLLAVYAILVHSSIEGWTSIVVLILMLGGIILSCLGIVGLYIGEIFEQVRGRPLFVIDRSGDSPSIDLSIRPAPNPDDV